MTPFQRTLRPWPPPVVVYRATRTTEGLFTPVHLPSGLVSWVWLGDFGVSLTADVQGVN